METKERKWPKKVNHHSLKQCKERMEDLTKKGQDTSDFYIAITEKYGQLLFENMRKK